MFRHSAKPSKSPDPVPDSSTDPPISKPARRRHSRLFRFSRATVVTLVVLAVLLVAARLALPTWLRHYVNRTLSQSQMYDGRIGDIHVHLWRGAYSIEDIKLVKVTNSVPVPFFEARTVDLSLDWRSLRHGVARGKIVMDHPQLNFVQGPTPQQSQNGAGEPWLAIIDDLFPFRIDQAIIKDGEIHFQAFHTKPEVDVFLTDVQAQVLNLTNVENKVDPLMARVTVRATAMHSGHFQYEMTFDPSAHQPSFQMAARLVNLDVVRLNSLTQAYGMFDFEHGQFDFVIEATAKDGQITGYAKPLFRHIQILGPRDFRTKDPVRLFWEALVGLVGAVFKNQMRDQFGTRLDFQGSLDNPRTSILEVIGNVLRNAFVRAYLPRLEGRVAPEAIEFQPGKEDEEGTNP